jgi:hypothetical protein
MSSTKIQGISYTECPTTLYRNFRTRFLTSSSSSRVRLATVTKLRAFDMWMNKDRRAQKQISWTRGSIYFNVMLQCVYKNCWKLPHYSGSFKCANSKGRLHCHAGSTSDGLSGECCQFIFQDVSASVILSHCIHLTCSLLKLTGKRKVQS